MQLFGLEIKVAPKDSNGKYVKQEECHRSMDSIKDIFTQRFDDVIISINQRFDDMKDFFLKNGH
jgi:hypothetical protein